MMLKDALWTLLAAVAVKVQLGDHADHVTAEPGGRFFVLSQQPEKSSSACTVANTFILPFCFFSQWIQWTSKCSFDFKLMLIVIILMHEPKHFNQLYFSQI